MFCAWYRVHGYIATWDLRAKRKLCENQNSDPAELMRSLWSIQLKSLGFIAGLEVRKTSALLSYKAEGMGIFLIGKFVRACNFLRVAKRCIYTYRTLDVGQNQDLPGYQKSDPGKLIGIHWTV